MALRMVRERTLTVAAPKVTAAPDVARIAHAMIGAAPVEYMILIAFDSASNVTNVATVAQGGISGMTIDVASVLRTALASHAAAFVLAHNHPSGNPEASPEDIATTRKIRQAASIVGVPMLDHIVVTHDPNVYRSVPE